MKWLAAGGLVVIGLLVFLFLQLRGAGEAVVAEAATKPAVPAAPPLKSDPVQVVKAPVAVGSSTTELAKPKKLDPQSDDFFFQFDEVVPKKLTAAAAECYTGGLNRVTRNQHLKVSYDNVIKDGVVSVANMKRLDGTNLNNPEMEQCMMAKMAAVKWTNDALPDGVWPDQLKITPERGMKKYTKENMEYQGDGPIGKAVMTKDSKPLTSDSASKTDFDRAEQDRIEKGGLPEGVK